MTAHELYDQSAAFRSFLDHWDTDRRCPYGLADWLMEHYPDMVGPAKCAQWCATQPDSKVFWPIDGVEREGECAPYPTACVKDGVVEDVTEWYWERRRDDNRNHPYLIPDESVTTWNAKGFLDDYPTPIDAILALMDAWNPEAEL